VDEPKVEIGLREIYDAVLELRGIVKGHPDTLDDHEARIRNLEMKVWGFAGIGSVASVLASIIINQGI